MPPSTSGLYLKHLSIAVRHELSGVSQSTGQVMPLRDQAAFTHLWDWESVCRGGRIYGWHLLGSTTLSRCLSGMHSLPQDLCSTHVNCQAGQGAEGPLHSSEGWELVDKQPLQSGTQLWGGVPIVAQKPACLQLISTPFVGSPPLAVFLFPSLWLPGITLPKKLLALVNNW